MVNQPHVIIIAGPNGADKSTTAPILLKDLLGVTEFVNADVIAQGLSAFATEAVAFQAGRIMLKRLHELANKRRNFAFETTLSTRSYAAFLQRLQTQGNRVYLIFLWLPSPEMAIARVAERVLGGGHYVPNDGIQRRYHRGLSNLFKLYLPLANQWRIYDNADSDGAKLIARGNFDQINDLVNPQLGSI
ncbi:zeta toxin family protein [Methyloglobulus sp.]|uniref:zeta toxin family protein n=1 Tax=Methyloglobulus sp. TaxID=2518622 RepID=UPI0039894486